MGAKRTLALLICLLSIVGSRGRAEDGTAAEWIAKGDAAFDEFDNKKALYYYEKAWKLDGKNVELLTKLTWACNNVGEDLASKESEGYFERARVYAEKLQRLAPREAKTWFLSAVTSGNLGLHRGGRQKVVLSRHVEADARKCIALDPEFAPGYVTLGVYYREVATLNWVLKQIAKRLLGGLPTGTLEDSERMLLKGIEKDPVSTHAYFHLAKTYEEMKNKEKALECYRKVIELPVTDHQDPTFKEEAKAREKKLK